MTDCIMTGSNISRRWESKLQAGSGEVQEESGQQTMRWGQEGQRELLEGGSKLLAHRFVGRATI